jgi:fumarate hydratase class II
MPGQTFRVERDSLGDVKIPKDAYWGAQTQRAKENFNISHLVFPREYIHALGMIKMTAAEVNEELNRLEPPIAEAIAKAAREVMEGKWDRHFVVDIFQTGSGTSTNMNANEVIANRANEILGHEIGKKEPVHPNDHVNKGQSSNDVIPTAIHVAALLAVTDHLIPVLQELGKVLSRKAEEFFPVIKTGRTHLQDATPVRLGQEFGGFASMVGHGIERLKNTPPHLSELPLGGTAVGTGINSHPEFAAKVIAKINKLTGQSFREADDHFEAQGAKDSLVEVSGTLRTLAVSLMKIANDIRWLGSGPRNGIGEIILPSLQPGSSIMPGKVNPVMPEALIQVCAQAMGNDVTIAIAGQGGNFELNTMMPVLAHNLLQSIFLLSNGVNAFTEKCCRGIRADEEICRQSIEKSLGLATSLAPHIGYDRAAEIAEEAHTSGRTIREVVLQKNLFDEEKLNEILDLQKMV